MDAFSVLFSAIAPTARSFFAGNLCETFQSIPSVGHLHLFKGGSLTLRHNGEADIILSHPTLLFYPGGFPHSFVCDAQRSADLVCATIDLGNSAGYAVSQGLPNYIHLPLDGHPALQPVCDLLVAEGFSNSMGRQVALDHVFVYLLVLILRHSLDNGIANSGVLAGLADPRLLKALVAMHDLPQKPWTVEELANVAGMSRTRFAAYFNSVVGQTPIDYLTRWRMMQARQFLLKGRTIKTAARAIGYDSAAAFSRVFKRIMQESPSKFINNIKILAK